MCNAHAQCAKHETLRSQGRENQRENGREGVLTLCEGEVIAASVMVENMSPSVNFSYVPKTICSVEALALRQSGRTQPRSSKLVQHKSGCKSRTAPNETARSTMCPSCT